MLRDLTAILALLVLVPLAETACSDSGTVVSPPIGICGASCGCDCASVTCGCGCGCGCACGSTSSSCSTTCGTTCPAPPVVCHAGQTVDCVVGSASDGSTCGAGVRRCAPSRTGFGPCEDAPVAAASSCDGAASFACDGADDAPVCGRATAVAVYGGASAGGAQSLYVDAAGGRVVTGVVGDAPLDLGGGSSVVGASPGTPFVAAFDAAGAPLWAVAIDGAQSAVVAGLPDGSVIVAGVYTGQLNIGGLTSAAAALPTSYAMRLDPAGEPIWVRAIAKEGGPLVTAIATSPASDVVVAGDYLGRHQTVGGVKLERADAGGAFIARLDDAGEVTRVSTYVDAPTVFHVGALAVAANGDALAASPAGADVACDFGAWLLHDPGTPPTLPPSDGGRRRTTLPVNPVALAFDAEGRVVIAGAMVVPSAIGGALVSAPGMIAVIGPNGATTALPLAWEPAAVAASDSIVLAGADASGVHLAKYDADLRPYYDRTFAIQAPAGEGAKASIGGLSVASGAPVLVGGLHGQVDFGLGFEQVRATSRPGDGIDPFVLALEP